MSTVAIAYHSGYGHTAVVAQAVARGVNSVAGASAVLVPVEEADARLNELHAADAIIFGAPTYMGSASAPFKTFMDGTSKFFATGVWKNKLAAGFTVSASQNGDKLNTLIQLTIFAMQHGMVWVGNPILPEQHSGVPYDEAANRLGSWSGLMAQAGHSAPADSFVPGDVKTARMFGRNVANTLLRVNDKAQQRAPVEA